MPVRYSTTGVTYPPLITLIRRLDRRLNSNRRHSRIHTTLNDDVLLDIFHFCRPEELGEYDDRTGAVWHHQRWWYKLAHVCRRWRNLILESPSRLDLHLYCTNGVPVADMLAHSPPLPLAIYYTHREITAEDESSILLALLHRGRVRHIYLQRLPRVGKFITVMGDQFPILERMCIYSRTEVALPVTFQAPNLRYLTLRMAFIPIGSPLLTTAAGIVVLSIRIPASPYFSPNYMLARISLMLQLESLTIAFRSPIPNRDVEIRSESVQTLDIIILPNLRLFAFDGVSVYLEGLVSRISAPSLSTFHVDLSDHLELPFTAPHLLQFMQTSENLTLSAVQVTFGVLAVALRAVPYWNTPLMLRIRCEHLDWQVASAVQLLGTLSPVLSVVEQVTFTYQEHERSSNLHNNVIRTQWRELLRPFTNTKTIHIQDDLVSKISSSLPSDDGEPPLELLPNLEKVVYSGGSSARNAFTTFLDERQAAGHPVSLRSVDHSVFDELRAYYV